MRDPALVAGHIADDLAALHEPGYGTTGMLRAIYVDDLVVVADDVLLTPP